MAGILARFCAAAAACLLQGVGVSVERAGTVLYYGGRACHVIRECSGIRSLSAALVLAGYICLSDRPGTRHAIRLLAVAATAAVAGNILRICACVLDPGLHTLTSYIAAGGALWITVEADGAMRGRGRRK